MMNSKKKNLEKKMKFNMGIQLNPNRIESNRIESESNRVDVLIEML
jgi:hypothetical protein